MDTSSQPATKRFAQAREAAKKLLAEDGFYQLKDKVRTTDEVHSLAQVVEDLVLRLEQEETRASLEATRADELERNLQLAQARGFSGPDSSYGNVRERIEELERDNALFNRQREDERERLQMIIEQRQSEWERAEAFGAALHGIVAEDMDIDQARGIANEALSSYAAPA